MHGCKSYVLPAGVERIINIQAGILRENLAEGKNLPVVAIREGEDNPKTLTVRHVEILAYHAVSGDCTCCVEHRPDRPLADTGGRGVVYIRTNAPLRVWVDED